MAKNDNAANLAQINQERAIYFLEQATSLFATEQLTEDELKPLERLLNFVKILLKSPNKAIADKVEEFLNPRCEVAYKNLIQCIYNNMANDESRANETLANELNEKINGTLSGEKYINELLQNADDALALDSEDKQVKFILQGDTLIFQHGGRNFSLRDVQGISDLARQDSEKRTENKDTTGQKGIGFKAVFSIADAVSILSSHARFKFDKQHLAWKENSGNLPWQLIPIWLELGELELEIKANTNNKCVNFIFKLKPEQTEKVEGAINGLIQQPKILLFLRHITGISFQNNKVTQCIRKEYNIENNSCKLITDKNQGEEWLCYSHEVAFAPDVQEKIRKINGLPDKFKRTNSTTIKFAAPVDPDCSNWHRSSNVLYSYLPTEVTLYLPYLVNADFHLNEERTKLNDGSTLEWNLLLIEHIAFAQFKWFEKLAQQNQHWQLPPSLVAHPKSLRFPNSLKGARESFEKGYVQGVNIAFVRSRWPDGELLTIESCHLDEHGFFDQFGSDEIRICLPHSEYSAEQLSAIADLKNTKLSSAQFKSKDPTVIKILNFISEPEFKQTLQQPGRCLALLEFFYQLSNSFNQEAKKHLVDDLKYLHIILTKNGKVLRPIKDQSEQNIYMPNMPYRPLLELEGLNIEIIHENLNGFFKKEDPDMFKKLPKEEQAKRTAEITKRKDWFKSLGIVPISMSAIVTKINDCSDQFRREFLQKAFQLYQYKKITNDDCKTLSRLYLQHDVESQETASSISSIALYECYLSDAFMPAVSIEQIATNYRFLPADVMLSPDPKKWREFLALAGVQQTITLHNIEKIIDALPGDTAHFKFVILLFDIYQKSLDHELFKKPADGKLTWQNKLRIRTTKDNYANPSECYLADVYDPELHLESMIENGINFVSSDYCQIEDDQEDNVLLKWHDFFVLLGVKVNIKINVFDTPVTHPSMSSGYIKYLESTSDTSQVCIPQGKHYTRAWEKGHTDLNYINPYFAFDYCDLILGTRIFWIIVQQNWKTIFANAQNVKCYNQPRNPDYKFERKVISNVVFLALESIKCSYAKKSVPLDHEKLKQLSDFYSPKLNDLIGSHLPVADTEGIDLDEVQISFFKFKERLSFVDAVYLLNCFAKEPVNGELIDKIIEVYRHIIGSNDVKNAEVLQELSLLTQADSFESCTLPIYGWLILDSLIPIPSSKHIFKRGKLTLRDYEKLCKLLSISVVNKDRLSIVTEPQIGTNSQLSDRLMEKLPYLIIPEACKEDYLHNPKKFESRLKEIFQLVKQLIYAEVRKITISFKEIRVSVNAWISEQQLRYVATNDKLLGSTKLTIAKHLLVYLKLQHLNDDQCKDLIFEETNEEELVCRFGEKATPILQKAKEIMAKIVSPVAENLSDSSIEAKPKQTQTKKRQIAGNDGQQTVDKTPEVSSQTPPAASKKSRAIESDTSEPKIVGHVVGAAVLTVVEKSTAIHQAAVASIEMQNDAAMAAQPSQSQSHHQTKKRPPVNGDEQPAGDEPTDTSHLAPAAAPKKSRVDENKTGETRKEEHVERIPSRTASSGNDATSAESVKPLPKLDPTPHMKVTRDYREDNGIKAERFIFDWMQKVHYSKKIAQQKESRYIGRYKECEESQEGFKVIGEKGYKRITWLNINKKQKDQKSRAEYDLLIGTFVGENTEPCRQRAIEVKSNWGVKEKSGTFSVDRELKLMRERGKDYTLYHVSNVSGGEDSWEGIKVKNPARVLAEKKIEGRPVEEKFDFDKLYADPRFKLGK